MTKLFKNARLKGVDELVDIVVEDGIFKTIGTTIDKTTTIVETVDLQGNLVVPPYVDPHIHLDYVFTAERLMRQNESGTLFEGIEKWGEEKQNITIEDVKRRAHLGIRKEMQHGVQYMRTHVDVTEPNLIALKAMLEVKEEVKDFCTIQIVAFPQEGMYSYPKGDELLEEALVMGADCVGGIPHYEMARVFGEKSVHKIVELAVKYDRLIDIHCDETDDAQSRHLELLSALAYMEGIGSRTTASHTCSLGSADNSYAIKLIRDLQKSRVNFVACPTENIFLQGRQDAYPKRRGMTRVKELNDSGINVCFAQDSLSDPWYPLGNGNLMNILDHGVHIAQMLSPREIMDALDLITVNGAKALNIGSSYGIECGKSANFIVIEAKSEFEALCERAGILLSVRNGKTIVEVSPRTVRMNL